MKRAVTAIVLTTLLLTPVLTVSAQKTRGGRIKTTAPAPAPAETAFASAEAYTDGTGVVVKWTMAQEVKNLGFNVYRLDTKGERIVSDDIVLGAATRFHADSVAGQSYEFVGDAAAGSSVYFVEAIGMDGRRIRSTSVAPSYLNDIKVVTRLPKVDRSAGIVAAKELELDKELRSEVESNAAAPDPTTHREVISRPGVKIGVKGEGLFRVTRDQLQAAGFNVASDSSLWQLHVNGNEQAINIAADGSYIEFYGKGVDTIESDIQTYYLTVGGSAGKRMQTRGTRLSTSTVSAVAYPETKLVKERTNYLSQIFNGPGENYFGRPILSSGTTFPLSLSGIDTTASQATITLRFMGYSFDVHVVELVLNGHALPSVNSLGREPFSTTVTVPTDWLVEGTNSIQMRSAGPAGDVSWFDSVQVSFSRRYLAEQNQLKFFTSNYKRTNVTGFATANVRVFDITNENDPALMLGVPVVQQGATFTAALPAGRGRVFYAVDDSAVKSVQSIVPNDPTLLASPTNAGKLIIIAHRSMMDQANAWANYRRSQGISVVVTESSEIYDEFNYGVFSSDAVKVFLAYATDNWQTPPAYVLLLGDASFDSRNYQGTGYWNMVPTKFVDTIFSEVGSDEALADFNGDGLSELAIGRIPTRIPQDAADILARQITWEAALPANPLARGNVFAFDLPSGYDFEGMSIRMRDQLPAGTPSTMVSRASATAQADLMTALNTGPYLVNYSGHGSTGVWASTGFFGIANVPQLVNSPSSRPIYTMLTCLNGYFMNLTNDSLAELLIKSPNGGAISAWASTGETTPDVQEIMGLRFYNQIGSGPASLNRLGDLIKDAKTVIPGGSDVRLSWALIGDPMLKVR
jgi:hypothetical protein